MNFEPINKINKFLEFKFMRERKKALVLSEHLQAVSLAAEAIRRLNVSDEQKAYLLSRLLAKN